MGALVNMVFAKIAHSCVEWGAVPQSFCKGGSRVGGGVGVGWGEATTPLTSPLSFTGAFLYMF